MRTKAEWKGKIKASPRTEGRTVIIPIELENDPDRRVFVRVPYSHVLRQIRSLEKAMRKIEQAA